MAESLGQEWERKRKKRIAKIAPQLASIMDKNTSAYNFGDEIISIRDMMWDDLAKRKLLPPDAELDCCALKSLWVIAMGAIDKYSQ